MFLLLTCSHYSALLCSTQYKPPAKAGTLASPLQRTQDVITALCSKNDTQFAKRSALASQFLACRLLAMMGLWVVWLWSGKTRSRIIFSVFFLSRVTKSRCCMHGQFQFFSKESGTGLLLLLCQLVSGKKLQNIYPKPGGGKWVSSPTALQVLQGFDNILSMKVHIFFSLR